MVPDSHRQPVLRMMGTDEGSSTVAAADAVSVSFTDMIVSIVPGDIVKPFLNSNMLQIIFGAVMVGISIGVLGERLSAIRQFIDDSYQVFPRGIFLFGVKTGVEGRRNKLAFPKYAK